MCMKNVTLLERQLQMRHPLKHFHLFFYQTGNPVCFGNQQLLTV